jgi:hypothetical protein
MTTVFYSQDELPENVSFVQDDVTIGLPWPDQTVDVIHARMLFAGVSFITRLWYLLRSDGSSPLDSRLLCHCEGSGESTQA